MAANIKLKEIKHPLLQIIGIGALAGMRTSSAPAITSQILSHHHSKRLEKSRLSFMQSKAVANTLTVLSIGEVVMDKLPSTGNRIEPGGVIFRGISGALAGASISKASGNNVWVGSVIGAASAVAFTYLSFIVRKTAGKKTTIIDPILGGIEDALVIGAGIGLAQVA